MDYKNIDVVFPTDGAKPEPATKEVEYSCLMARRADVSTTDYIAGTCYREWDGDSLVDSYDDADFSGTDWLNEYWEQHYTPMRLIEILSEASEALANGKMPQGSKEYWRNVRRECEGWEMSDEQIEL